MNLKLTLLLALLVLIGCARPMPTDDGPVVIDDRELLVMTAQSPTGLMTTVEQLGYVVLRVEALDHLGDETLVTLRIPAERTILQAIDEVEELYPEATAGANHAYTLQAIPRDQDFANTLIGWPETGCSAMRPVGILDAGLAPMHPALESGQVIQRSFHRASSAPTSDHGALIAEILIGQGRLAGARLYSANVVDPTRGNGDVAGVDAILRGIDWLRGRGVSLINISLAGPFNKLLKRGLGQAASEGVIFVAAAGNQGPDAAPQYPAAFEFALAVTAIDQNQSIYRRSVQGNHIDFAAPGVDIVLSSEGRLRIMSGTSAAAPFVTAVIAADPSLGSASNSDAVRKRLAQDALDLGVSGRDSIFGIGLVRVPKDCVRTTRSQEKNGKARGRPQESARFASE